MNTTVKHTVMPENAAKFRDWIENRGGVAVWESVDLSDVDFSMSSPALDKDGNPFQKPHWKVGNTPARIITDPNDIEVIAPKEVKRFRVGIRMGSQGMSLKVTDGGTRKIRAAVERAGPGAWYGFDYETQEAVIYAPNSRVLLKDWRP